MFVVTLAAGSQQPPAAEQDSLRGGYLVLCNASLLKISTLIMSYILLLFHSKSITIPLLMSLLLNEPPMGLSPTLNSNEMNFSTLNSNEFQFWCHLRATPTPTQHKNTPQHKIISRQDEGTLADNGAYLFLRHRRSEGQHAYGPNSWRVFI